MKEKVEFRKIRDFGEIIGDTFLFIKQNLKPLFKAFLYLCGIFVVAGIITSIIAQTQMASSVEMASVAPTYGRRMVWSTFSDFALQYLLMFSFLFLTYTAIYATTYSFVALYVQKGNIPPSVEEVWSYYKFYFFKILGSSIILTFFAVLCFVCCIVPGIYVFPAISIFFPVMVMENAGFGYSFDRSFKLLKQEWWITAAVFMVIWIITFACTSIIQLPATIIAMVSAFTHAEKPITKIYAIITAICQYASQIFYIIPLIASTLIYFNLVERKENSGLLSRIDSLGQNADHNDSTPEEY